MRYVLGFRNAHRLTIDVSNGTKFVNDIVAALSGQTAESMQWYGEPGLLLNISELNFVIPESCIKEQGEP
jgi:hypothetical protein